jgi:homogentisate 1,2-dioxygenase
MGVYACNTSMENEAFFNSDSDFLIVPQEGKISIMIELGLLEAESWEIVVVQRGIKLAVSFKGEASGYYL